MENAISPETIIELKKYFNKLNTLVKNNASFKFFSLTLINKQKCDDIFCCIESIMPKEYKNYTKNQGKKKLTSAKSYKSLTDHIRKKKLFSSKTSYQIDSAYTIKLIGEIIVTIEQDIRYVEKNPITKTLG